MNITYKVIDSRTGEDITDDYYWVIRPDGVLGYLDYCDVIGYPSAKAVITVVED